MNRSALNPAMELLPIEAVRTIGLIGMGTVGGGWAAAFLAHGCRVLAYDPDPSAPEKAAKLIRDAWPALRELGLAQEEFAPLDRLQFSSLQEVAERSDAIHENAPEVLELKRDLLNKAVLAARPNTVICSSSGGLVPSQLQEGVEGGWRILVAHPFNPPHLVPLVEVIGGRETADHVIEWTMALLRNLGKRPIRLNSERTAFLTNRLQFALLREAVHCLVENVASPQSIDDAVKYALGPRWAAMGSLMTLALAGGEGGMQTVLERFAPAIDEWWTDLGSPRLTPETQRKLIEAADAITSGKPLADWIKLRDQKLVKLLHLLADESPP